MLTSRLDAYISRYGDFCANDNNDDNNDDTTDACVRGNNDDDTTDYFTPCACARGNDCKLTRVHVWSVCRGRSACVEGEVLKG